MNITNNSNAWHLIWNFISNMFLAVKNFMQSVTIFSIGESFHTSLWDLCLGIIIMSAIIGQFIIFSKPVLPDQPTGNWREDRANKRFRRERTSNARKNH